MKTQEFLDAYNESRNGASFFVRHPFNRRFQYSDGVQSIADAGCHWLIDVLATEVYKFLDKEGGLGVLRIDVSQGQIADLYLEVDDDLPPVWKRIGVHTDMPPGQYMLYMVDEGDRIACILTSEY